MLWKTCYTRVNIVSRKLWTYAQPNIGYIHIPLTKTQKKKKSFPKNQSNQAETSFFYFLFIFKTSPKLRTDLGGEESRNARSRSLLIGWGRCRRKELDLEFFHWTLPWSQGPSRAGSLPPSASMTSMPQWPGPDHVLVVKPLGLSNLNENIESIGPRSMVGHIENSETNVLLDEILVR